MPDDERLSEIRKLFNGSTLRLPAVVVDLDAFDRNVAKLRHYLGSTPKTLRLATKSVRVPALIERVLKAGPPFQGLMCFSAEEASFLFERGFKDLLLAYPTFQSAELQCLRSIHEQGGQVSMVVDDVGTLGTLARAMKGVSEPFPVLLDIDVSWRGLGGWIHLGVRRSPLRAKSEINALLDAIAGYRELKPIGAMAYEAQVAGLGDKNPFKRLINPIAKIIRKISVCSVARARRDVAEVFAKRGLELRVFNGGGTGSITYAVTESVLTELSAGSGLLCPHLFDYYSNVQFEPACFFALQVVRKSDQDHLTCQGGGYVASGEPGWDRLPLPVFPNGAKLISMEGVGEVQTPLKLDSPGLHAALPIGSSVLFRHAKAGELAERFNEYLLVSGGKVVDRAKTYRGYGKCFF